MGDTDDPRERLHHGDVAERAAAARQLAREGIWDDLDDLVRLATDHPSSAVRLYTAAAAADIVHRERAAGGIDVARELDLLSWVGGIDPGRTPGLLMLLSAVEDRRALDRLGRMLRDPRNTVRAGAAAALRRMALSATAAHRTDIGPRVAAWLAHPKLPSDAAHDLVQLVGEAGLTDAADAIGAHAHRSGRHADAVATARERLAARRTRQAWSGLWRSDGLDVMEAAVSPQPPTWLVIGDPEARLDGRPIDVIVHDAGVRIGEETCRLVFAPPLGDPNARIRVIQRAGRCFWALEGKPLVQALDTDPEAVPPFPAGVPDPTADIDGAAGPRVRALWAWRSGDLDAARSGLEALTGRARPRHALFYWLARVCEDQGDATAAREAATAYLSRAKAKAPFRDRAEALVARLAT